MRVFMCVCLCVSCCAFFGHFYVVARAIGFHKNSKKYSNNSKAPMSWTKLELKKKRCHRAYFAILYNIMNVNFIAYVGILIYIFFSVSVFFSVACFFRTSSLYVNVYRCIAMILSAGHCHRMYFSMLFGVWPFINADFFCCTHTRIFFPFSPFSALIF